MAQRANIHIRFQPFTIYPELPRGDGPGLDKLAFFKRLGESRNPTRSEEDRQLYWTRKQQQWDSHGLTLRMAGGNIGNSLDAQRLILLSRKQGREDEMIEAIYKANHEEDKCLSDWATLLEAAERARVEGAQAMLESDEGFKEITTTIQRYHAMGITSVPVLVIDDTHFIEGAPDVATLTRVLKGLLDT